MLNNLDIGGWVGCGNIEITGPGGAVCHVEIRPGIVRIGFGAREDADGTIILNVRTFFELLSGEGSFAGAMMTGKMRIQGEGHLSFLIGTLASQFQAAASGKYPGILATLGPWWAKLVLMLSDKTLTPSGG